MKINLPTNFKFDSYIILNAEGFLLIDYWNTYTGYRTQNIWVKCISRKPMTCILTGNKISKGTEVYRPATNGLNRRHRMLANELEKYLPKRKSIN